MNLLRYRIMTKDTLNKKIVSLTKYILIIITISLGLLFFIVNIISAILSSSSNLQDKSRITAMNITKTLNEYTSLVSSIAQDTTFIDETSTLTEKQSKLNESIKNNGLINADFIDINGTSSLGVTNANDEFIQKSKETLSTTISDVFLDKETSKMVISFASPTIVDYEYKGTAIITLEATFLTDLIKNIDENCEEEIYILDSNGNYLAYKFYNYVSESKNIIDIYNNESHLGLKNITEGMLSGKTGSGFIAYNGFRYAAYAPIDHTNNWSISLSVSCLEMIKPYMLGLLFCTIIMIIIVLVGLKLSTNITNTITNGITECTNRINLLSQGDLSTPVQKIQTNDEMEILSESLNTTILTLNRIISDITNNLEQFEQGNFKLQFDEDYIGDFKPIQNSFINFVNILGNVLKNINQASNNVLIQSEKMSEDSLSLSEGAIEQTTKIEEISASISIINEKVIEKSNLSIQENNNINNAHLKIKKDSAENINKLLDAMNNITASSEQIQNIIQTIEDISEQTDLLALNASIEAARAGEHGKGFSVVASEISLLANQSNRATNSTKELIENSINSIQAGTSIVKDINHFFDELVNTTNEFTKYINEQSNFYSMQSEEINNINYSIEKIAEVVENNAINAENTASISEILKEEAASLQKEIEIFKY